MRFLFCLSLLNLCSSFFVKTFRTPNFRIEGTFSTNKKTYTFEGSDANDEIYTLPLINDINRLSEILSNIINTESKPIHDLYLTFINCALAHSSGDENALNPMINLAKTMTAEDALGVTRAFTQTLNLINAAEVHHRMRYLRALDFDVMSPLPMREDSIAGSIENILSKTSKASLGEVEDMKKLIYDKLLNQKVEIIYTAHPTEVNRRTLLRKYRSVSESLQTLDRRDLSNYERAQTEEGLRRVIASIWGSDEIRRDKPTPQQEAKGGLAIVESVLWDAVPDYLRKLNAQCIISLNRSLPIEHAPIKFGSWMGGDRDGNPNVTPKVTYQVAITQRLQAAKLLLEDVDKLYSQLAVCKGFSPELVSLAREIRFSSDKRELYRRVIGHLQQRLLSTIRWCEQELRGTDMMPSALDTLLAVTQSHVANGLTHQESSNMNEGNIEPNPADYVSILKPSNSPMFDTKELLEPLSIMHRSLCHGGYDEVADGLLIDIIRRVAVFGLTLCPLDLRQESGRHTDALDSITRYLGIGSYAQWDEVTKINWLQNEIAGKRPLFRADDIEQMGFSPTVLDTLKTIETAAKLGPDSLGAYVISQARSASDVLAVMLLQKQYGLTANNGRMLRVVPLFETLNDLTNAPQVMQTLFSLPNYIGMIKNKHEVMIGYSDSAKDAGRLSAGWAQYESQEIMVKIAEKFNVELTFFHGKGGTVGRGGNPALYRAVLAHPPKTINGRFRVTEQGEMITQNFGSTGIAERTLDIYTAAVLAEQFVKHVDPLPKWRKQMSRLSQLSCTSYQSLITKRSFIQYFRQSTPELELGSLNIGSRPAKRNPEGGIESLRAIPWTFAWSQIRLHLPAWYGVNEALDCKNDEATLAELREMYTEWPFFRETVDLIAMTLSKADAEISKNYEQQLVSPDNKELIELGDVLRENLNKTIMSILLVSDCDDLSCGFRMLERSMKTRYPYVDPLNVIQAEVMKRLRTINACIAKDDPQAKSPAVLATKSLLEDTLIVSINGISQGMKNSG